MTTLSNDVVFTYDQFKALTDQAFDLVDAGDVEAAAVMFAGIVALWPEDPKLLAAYGSVLHRLTKEDDALHVYDQALRLDSEVTLARVNRGDLRCQRGDLGGLDDLRIAAAKPSSVQARAQRLLRRYSR